MEAGEEEEEGGASVAPPLTAPPGRPCAPGGATVRRVTSPRVTPRPASVAPPPTAPPGPPPAPSGATVRRGGALKEVRTGGKVPLIPIK